jgi:hypothetical protein
MPTIREAAKAEFGWTDDTALRNLFLQSLPPSRRMVGRILWSYRRQYFAEDIKWLKQILETDSYQKISVFCREFGHPHRDLSFWRDTVGIRPRGRRIVKFAKILLIKEGSGTKFGRLESNRDVSEFSDIPDLENQQLNHEIRSGT